MHPSHGLSTDILGHIPPMSFPSGIIQHYVTRIEKHVKCTFHLAHSEILWWRISSTSSNIIYMALCKTLILCSFHKWRMLLESGPAPQLLQTKISHIKNHLSYPVCYYQPAVPLHIQAGEMQPRCVRFAPHATCTLLWCCAARHEPDKLPELNLPATRQSYQKHRDKPSELIRDCGTIIIP